MNRYSDIAYACKQLKKDEGRPVVLATGCFDVLHVGHVDLLWFADQIGAVFVGINSDRAVKKLKGESRPINNESDRKYIIQSIYCVHNAFIIDEETVINALLEIQPDYWVKGSDYTLETLNQKERGAAEYVGAKIVFVPKTEGHSSTKIIEKLKQ